ncbi:hypothetical protein MBLNU457_4387t1 [Dothideomycetes sp. NU457]
MQGFNMGRYVPPDLEGLMSANKASNKPHALGSRARKLASQGILTVRFEMPFAVWCSSCPKPTLIAQGVRFNAEKKKVGMYFSTPIWSFRIKHAVCGGGLEIRTDPKNTRYVVFEGGKERDYGDVVKEGEEGREILTAEERERRREDAFAVLEDRVVDQRVKVDTRRRIEELQDERERHWGNPYEASRMVRRGFRRERKERVRERDKVEGIQSRLGLGVELLPERPEDAQRAALVEYGDFREEDALARPLFEMESAKGGRDTTDRKRKVVLDADRKRRLLEKQLRDNTRAARNPFGIQQTISPSSTSASKNAGPRAEAGLDTHTTGASSSGPKQIAASLVYYDSE